ncbi:MAG: hypothetical protein JWR33_1930 [Naasia sp.]|jgi:membrane protein YdbS with pleckstrin-like domain|uniref:PH domain-containing protein n=1 Tax=Naasia sp. TaxID=2546198 RepID=UPI002620B55B|nr:PH domain-containing protein [Naasia sp.]MCU1571189.1 hypothetical protein [Naasia sp.]
MARRIEVTDGPWRRVSPKQVGVEMVGGIVMTLLTALAAAVAFLLDIPMLGAVLSGVSLLSLVMVLFVPRRVRAYGYQLRDDDLLFRRGLLLQRFVSVPYGRMQLIDINRGPLARALHLSELKFVTAAAATGVTIPGLPEEEAERLRDSLVQLAESRRVGL